MSVVAFVSKMLIVEKKKRVRISIGALFMAGHYMKTWKTLAIWGWGEYCFSWLKLFQVILN